MHLNVATTYFYNFCNIHHLQSGLPFLPKKSLFLEQNSIKNVFGCVAFFLEVISVRGLFLLWKRVRFQHTKHLQQTTLKTSKLNI